MLDLSEISSLWYFLSLCCDLSEDFYELGWRNSSESFTDQDCDITKPLNLSIMELGHVPATSERVSKSDSNRQY